MNRKAIAVAKLFADRGRINPAEVKRHREKRADVSDSIVSVKAFVPAGGNVPILDAENNKDAIIGVVDFEGGQIKGINGQGSIVVEAIKIGYSEGAVEDLAYAKRFSQEEMPADIEHSYLEIIQDGVIIKRVHVSPFAMAGDSAQTVNGGRVLLGEPFTLAGGVDTEIRLRRPKQIAGTACFLAVDFIGMQSVNTIAG